jgi:erythronate-4-phosphate dehydrogenase
MKIVIDSNIPFIRGIFEPFAEVLYKTGTEIARNDLLDADALVTRTRTVCNETLLHGTRVKFIASATIGCDHIDTDFCRKNNIAWANASGCNSLAVAQYVLTALLHIAQKTGMQFDKTTIGIIGVGNIGKKIADICNILGMSVLLCDAPRKQNENKTLFLDIDEIVENTDIITLHVPLNICGKYKTYHLFDNDMFAKTKAKIFINTSRGEVVDTVALKSAITGNKINFSVIDVWENEPDIDKSLLSLISLATPHIAGYSQEGKIAGTRMAVQAISKFFNFKLENLQLENLPEVEKKIIVDCKEKSIVEILQNILQSAYNILSDSDLLKSNAENFEYLRTNYKYRREFAAYKIYAQNISAEKKKVLNLLQFNTVNY